MTRRTFIEERLEQLRREQRPGYERQQIRRDPPPPPPPSLPPEPEPDTRPRGIAEVTLEMVSQDVFAT